MRREDLSFSAAPHIFFFFFSPLGVKLGEKNLGFLGDRCFMLLWEEYFWTRIILLQWEEKNLHWEKKNLVIYGIDVLCCSEKKSTWFFFCRCQRFSIGVKDRIFMPGWVGGGGLVPNVKMNRQPADKSRYGLVLVGWLPIGAINQIRIIGYNWL